MRVTQLPIWARWAAIFSLANAINNQGEIAGQASTKDGQSRAVKWVKGKIIDCGTDADNSNALDINEAGIMVGYSGKTFGTSSHAIYWDTDNKPVLVDLPENWKVGGSAFRAINNKNQVVGYGSDTADGEHEGNAQAFIYALDTNKVTPYQGDDVNLIPNGINDAGEGVMTVFYGERNHGWKVPTAMPMELEGDLQLLDINEKGEVAACLGERMALMMKTTGDQIGVIRCGSGLPTRLNNQGVMVGVGKDGATLYENREALDLNALISANSGWKLSSANGINDKGQIVGFGEYKGSPMRAFLLTPTVTTFELDDLKLPE